MNINTRLNLATRRQFSSPPTQAAPQTATQETFDTVELSGAKAKTQPGLSTLQKVGLGVGLTVAIGGAFIAGAHFQSEPEPPTLESQVEDLGRDFRRGFEDFKIDLKRAGEDAKIGWNRGLEDADYGRSQEREQQRELEDSVRELKREVQDAKKDVGRKAKDFWRKLTD
jgi:hypothetical protein